MTRTTDTIQPEFTAKENLQYLVAEFLFDYDLDGQLMQKPDAKPMRKGILIERMRAFVDEVKQKHIDLDLTDYEAALAKLEKMPLKTYNTLLEDVQKLLSPDQAEELAEDETISFIPIQETVVIEAKTQASAPKPEPKSVVNFFDKLKKKILK